MKVASPKKTTVELIERAGPEIFRFENSGDCLRGRLVNIETADVGGKATLRYLIHQEEEGNLYSFLGTVDLNIKIRASDIGKILEVRYLGRDPETQEGKNPIKRFKVLVQKD